MGCFQYLVCFIVLLVCSALAGCGPSSESKEPSLNPEVLIPEVTVPEVIVPEVTVPEVIVPEVTVPEVIAPEPEEEIVDGEIPLPRSELKVPTAFKTTVLGSIVGTGCKPFPPPYTGELLFPSKYQGSDASRDTLNEEAQQQYQQLTADIKQLESLASHWSNRYLEGDLAARECALSMMEQWAINSALLSESANSTGQAVRKWALATLANSYLQLTQANPKPLLSDQSKSISQEIIEGWLVQIAESVREYYSGRAIEKVNNHDYWAAWAVMATSVAVNRHDLFDWSMSKFYEGVNQIDSNGYLPNELKRETRALSYHNYALQPLVWMAVFAEANNTYFNEQQSTAFSLLIDQTLAGIGDPSLFANVTGYKQVVGGLNSSYNLAWIEVWASTFSMTFGMIVQLDNHRPMRSTRMGGNVSLLFNTVEGRSITPRNIPKKAALLKTAVKS